LKVISSFFIYISKVFFISDLILNHNFIQFRCQAQNKFIPGEYSDVVNIKTQTFHFQLDATASHPNLKLVSPLQVEWEAAAIKGLQIANSNFYH